jgi:hypothetical protein
MAFFLIMKKSLKRLLKKMGPGKAVIDSLTNTAPHVRRDHQTGQYAIGIRRIRDA